MSANGQPAVLVTGTVGAEIVKLLTERGQPVRAGVRDPASTSWPDGARPVRFDFLEPDTFPAALRGAERLFLMRPPAVAWVERHLFPFIEAAENAGVRRVVFLSLIGAERNPIVPPRRVEKRLEASPMPHTFLRPAYFMQNLIAAQGADIRERDEIFVPAGHGKTAFVGARALTEDGHANVAYDLTGTEALDYFAVADGLSGVLNRRIEYANPSLLAYAWRMLRRGRPLGYVLVTSVLFTAARLGLSSRLAAEETGRVLGREPTCLRTFAEDHSDCWRP